MQRAEISFEDAQLEALEQLAKDQGLSVSDIVREAVDTYLIQRRAQRDDAQARMEILLARVRGRIPPEISPEEIEADITAAREEVRRERRTARGR